MVRDDTLPRGVEPPFRIRRQAQPVRKHRIAFRRVGKLFVLLVPAFADGARSVAADAVVGGNQFVVPNRQFGFLFVGKRVQNPVNPVGAYDFNVYIGFVVFPLFAYDRAHGFVGRRTAAVTGAVQQISHRQIIVFDILFEFLRRFFVAAHGFQRRRIALPV